MHALTDRHRVDARLVDRRMRCRCPVEATVFVMSVDSFDKI